MGTSGRRLNLSPIGFDIVLALSQAPDGLRLADLAHVMGSPVSSVQTALRGLISNQLVRREEVDPPRYLLAPDHPARDELASLATVLPEPAHAIGILLRANPVVAWAAVDSLGFVAATREPPATAPQEALDRHLGLVAGSRDETPIVMRLPEPEMDRVLRVGIGLRARLAKALTIKGRLPAVIRDMAERKRPAAG
ncbi:MAG TPA: helix-turn-helix domain-containing protein [Candidatus Limnocylindrales bacterium]